MGMEHLNSIYLQPTWVIDALSQYSNWALHRAVYFRQLLCESDSTLVNSLIYLHLAKHTYRDDAVS